MNSFPREHTTAGGWDIFINADQDMLDTYMRPAGVSMEINDAAIAETLEILKPGSGGRLTLYACDEAEIPNNMHGQIGGSTWEAKPKLNLPIVVHVAVAGAKGPRKSFHGDKMLTAQLKHLRDSRVRESIKKQKKTRIYEEDKLNRVMVHELQHVVDSTDPDIYKWDDETYKTSFKAESNLKYAAFLLTLAGLTHIGLPIDKGELDMAKLGLETSLTCLGIAQYGFITDLGIKYRTKHRPMEARAYARDQDYKLFPKMITLKDTHN